MSADTRRRLFYMLACVLVPLAFFMLGVQQGRRLERTDIGSVWQFSPDGRWQERGMDGVWRDRPAPLSPVLHLEGR
jgi:hypothetical protein